MKKYDIHELETIAKKAFCIYNCHIKLKGKNENNG